MAIQDEDGWDNWNLVSETEFGLILNWAKLNNILCNSRTQREDLINSHTYWIQMSEKNWQKWEEIMEGLNGYDGMYV